MTNSSKQRVCICPCVLPFVSFFFLFCNTFRSMEEVIGSIIKGIFEIGTEMEGWDYCCFGYFLRSEEQHGKGALF